MVDWLDKLKEDCWKQYRKEVKENVKKNNKNRSKFGKWLFGGNEESVVNSPLHKIIFLAGITIGIFNYQQYMDKREIEIKEQLNTQTEKNER